MGDVSGQEAMQTGVQSQLGQKQRQRGSPGGPQASLNMQIPMHLKN